MTISLLIIIIITDLYINWNHIVWSVENIQKKLNPQVSSISNGKTMIICNVKYAILENLNLFKKEAKGLLSKSGIKTPLSKIPLLDDILF